MEGKTGASFIKIKFRSLPRVFYALIDRGTEVRSESFDKAYHEVRYVDSGEITYRVEGGTVTLKSGDYGVFPAGYKYEAIGAPNAKTVTFNIGFFIDDGDCSVVDGEGVVFDVTDNKTFVENEVIYFPQFGSVRSVDRKYKMLKHVIMCYDSLEEYSNINVASGLVGFFVALAGDSLDFVKHGRNPEEDAAEKYCRKIDRYLEKNYMNVVTMRIVANHVGLHENYVSSMYKKKRGITVMNKLTDIRLETARKLLLKNKYTVADVARMVGFKDCKYFIYVFKKYEDVSPGKYIRTFYDDKVYTYTEVVD